MSTNILPYSLNAMDFLRPWMQLAPSTLVQPISFSINSNNSTAPQTEVAVVAEHSYGRQLGRISDALRELILETHEEPLDKTKPLGIFVETWKQIDAVKRESAAERVKQITSDLQMLKLSDDKTYRQLRRDLEQALKNTK